MELGMIGLGRMGGNMARRLIEGGHRVVVYDPAVTALDAVVKLGAVAATSPAELAQKLGRPRAIWLMVPAGEVTETTMNTLAAELEPGDVIVDGGNSNYKDSQRRARALAAAGINLLDAGTSGGVWGLAEGYCLMVGGDADAYGRLEPVFRTLAPASGDGYGRVGPSGAGHFVKMVHNGIEYGLMQAYAEGFELMQAKPDFDLDLTQIAEIWRHGSVVRSWLLDLTANALQEDAKLESLEAYVDDSGEGRWTVVEAVDLGVPLPVITAALQARFRSRQAQPFGVRLLAALRQQFGGHAVKRR
jgi:6-phosphogluconate dehydrogenase